MESSVKNLPKIDVRAAVSLAQKYFNDLQDMIGSSMISLRLEEVELSENKQFSFDQYFKLFFQDCYNTEYSYRS
ncbi:MAG TPA: hypothetical protein V6D21_21790 [Candidatus Obscuribacterales bacterium]